MKLRTAALAGASLLCFATPALAGEGWYLGLGAGYSMPENIKDRLTQSGGIYLESRTQRGSSSRSDTKCPKGSDSNLKTDMRIIR